LIDRVNQKFDYEKVMLCHAPRRAVAQLARVPVSKTGGWGFKSLLPCAVVERRKLKKKERGNEMSENSEKELNIFQRVALFYRQVLNELRKVVWPSRNMLTTYTAVVLVFVTFVIAVVSLFDLGLTQLVLFIFGE
jgi:preprotein translocase subunit SecE